MFFNFKRFFRTRKSRISLELNTKEIEILRRENLEANRENLRLKGPNAFPEDKSIDNLSAPGVVTGMSAIVARTADEQRARNKP